MISQGEKLELATRVGEAIIEAMNGPPVRTIGDSMEALGLALHLYFTALQKTLEEEEKN